MSITRKIPASTPPRRFLPKFFKTGKACGGNNSPRTPLFLPPGFAGSAGQDEREDYARGQGGGGECSRKAVFRRSGGPGRRQEHGRRQARSRNSVPALSAAAVVQARQFVQHVLPKRACVFFGRRKFGKTGTARGGAWRTLFGLRTQCRCVLTDSPAVADSCPAFAGQS